MTTAASERRGGDDVARTVASGAVSASESARASRPAAAITPGVVTVTAVRLTMMMLMRIEQKKKNFTFLTAKTLYSRILFESTLNPNCFRPLECSFDSRLYFISFIL